MGVYFGTITPENWHIFNELKVKDERKNYVASNVVILARAFELYSEFERERFKFI